MNAFELNKIMSAVLGALVFAMGLSVLSEIIFDEHSLFTPGYEVAIAEATGGAEAPEEVPLAVLLNEAEESKGQGLARVCGACHTFTEGGANGIGPNLHGVVGRPIASHEGFSYSGAMSTYSEGGARHWSYEELDEFLQSPQSDIPGTAMGYAGIKNDEDRADVIAYLKSVSPEAPAYPEVPAPTEEMAPDPAAAEAEAVQAEEVEANATAGDAGTAGSATPADATEAPATDAQSVTEKADTTGAAGQDTPNEADPAVQAVEQAAEEAVTEKQGEAAPAEATEAPATEAPAAEAPATEAPAAEAPATEAPAAEAPATEAPATEAPATEGNAAAGEAPATAQEAAEEAKDAAESQGAAQDEAVGAIQENGDANVTVEEAPAPNVEIVNPTNSSQ